MKRYMLGFAALSLAVPALAVQKPNIVLMYVDDLDFDQISVYDTENFPSYTGAKLTGNLQQLSPATANQNGRFLKTGEMSWYQDARMLTPNIQKLADEGVTLNRFYLTSSTCTPSRYSLLTGRYASRAPSVVAETPAGEPPIIAWNSYLLPQEGNLARDLRSAGYTTGLVGKWHISDYDIPGVDFSAGFRAHHTAAGTGGNLRPFQLVASYFPPTADYGDSEVQSEMKRIYEAMRQKVLNASGFDSVDRLYFANYGGLPMPEHMKVHNLEWQTEGALEFIEQNRDAPFFLYFSITAPHGQYFEDWMQKDWRATPAGMLTEKPKGMPSRESVRQRVLKAGLPLQNAMSTWIDDSLGAVLSKLEEHGLSDNTIVLFLSDHQSRGKLTVYEGNRAPGIIRWHGAIAPGSVEERIVSNIDIRPTLLAAAGAEPSDTVDGESILPILGRGGAWRASLLLETSYSRAVVSEHWKYIAHRPPQEVLDRMAVDRVAAGEGDGRRHVGWAGRYTNPASGMGVRFNADQDFPCYFDADQLYNLGDDVFEQNNLFGNPELTTKTEELQAQLNQHLANLPHAFGEFGRDK